MADAQCQSLRNVNIEDDVVNRPFKRRKFYRKRLEEEELEDSVTGPNQVKPSITPLTLDKLLSNRDADPNSSTIDKETTLSVADILRQRKAVQRKRGGIEFTNMSIVPKSSSTPPTHSKVPIGKDEAAADIEAVVNRFAPQTGQVADVDKHMMAYIDSELAKRRQASSNNTNSTLNGLGANGSAEPGMADLGIQRQPAALGKLHEIDLGPDATLRNIARTEAATKRLEGGEEEVEETTGKVRLRRDGKPWRPRRRRNSEDVKRDQLVEEVLRESRLEIYSTPSPSPPHHHLSSDTAADDRIAEQFRRDFMDAISSRRQKPSASGQGAAGSKAAKGQKGVDDRPKGPKLGGSRSARAAMREKELAEKAGKK